MARLALAPAVEPSLADLAATIRNEHAAYETTQSAAVAHAIAAGEALIEA